MGKRIGVAVVTAAALVGLVGALVAFPAVGEAADGAKWTLSLTKAYTASPWTHEAGYTNQMVGKLGFGIKNLLLGWTELFTEPKDALSAGTNFFVGVGKGLMNGLGQEVGGALHLVTFPITAIDVALPEGGTQLL